MIKLSVILAGYLFISCLICCYEVDIDTQNSEEYLGTYHHESFHDGVKREKRSIVVAGIIMAAVEIGSLLCAIFCKQEEPNRPPSIYCPIFTKDIIAEDGKTSAKVTWTLPTANDPEDGNLRVNLIMGQKSGSEFEQGTHSIKYSTVDKNGLKEFCSFSFKVVVVTCDHLRPPTYGQIWCGKSEILPGTTCDVTCHPGFELKSTSSNIKCIRNKARAYFVPSISIDSCEKVKCPDNDQKVKPKHGKAECVETASSTVCYTVCTVKGYSPEQNIFTVCNDNGQWSAKLPDCIDTQNPEINQCPTNIETYAGRKNTSVVVNWKEPEVKDNSNNVKLIQKQGKRPGSLFNFGREQIRYQAEDESGNLSPPCEFWVDVRELQCRAPYFNDHLIYYKCDGFSYGYECNLICKGNLSIDGNDTIVCEKDPKGDFSRAKWDTGQKEPICKRNPCKPLSSPSNGAISCDKWLFGTQCQMHCQDNYDIPAVGTGFNGILTCSFTTGLYGPINTAPNCTERKLPRQLGTLGEFFYYTGNCNDLTVLNQIKSNFISQLKILNDKKGYKNVCVNITECNVENVEVTCGPVLRKRRSLFSYIRRKRSNYEIRVELEISSAWQNTNYSHTNFYELTKQAHRFFFEKIKELGSSGKLNVNELVPVTESFAVGYTFPKCADGLLIRLGTLSCVPCVSGSFLTKNQRGRPVCTLCPRGFFKEDAFDVHCKKCPTEKSTVDIGSTQATDCIDKCGPGEYSDTGLVPCIPCAKSTYSNESMSKRCIKCPLDMTTEFLGSTHFKHCSRFDVMLKGDGDKIYLNKSSEQNPDSNFAFTTWFGLSDVSADVTLFHSKGLSVRIQNDIFIEKAGVRNWTSMNVSIQSGTWMHVAVVVQKISPFISVFLNGISKYTANEVPFTQAEMASLFEDMYFMINSTADSGVYLSGYHVVPKALSKEEILQSTKSCHAIIFDSIISMDILIKMSGAGLEVIVPSQCSSVNECDNDPCNGHRCLQKINGYACQCSNGFHGTHCELEPDYCKQEPCENGASCNITEDGKYTCLCTNGFKGIRCEMQIVNGGWSLWGQFSECSVTCNGGTTFRTRTCNNPTPDPEGITCNTSEATEILPCNKQHCPTCPRFKRTFGAISQCEQKSDGHTVCNVACRTGYSFLPGNTPLSEYTCGINTSYVWNGEPPACGKIDLPVLIATETEVSYNAPLECSKSSKASQNLRINLESSLQCTQNKTCTVKVAANGCTSSSRKKRSAFTQTQLVTITLISVKNSAGSSGESDQASDSVTKFLNAVSDLALSMQQLNSTNDMLNLEIDGERYTSTGQSFQTVVNCLDGQGRNTYFCVYCSPGTYSSSGSCILCNKGSYQDESGQMSCKPCPYGWSTQYIGSQSQQECSENVMEKSDPSYPEEDENKTLIIIISGAVCIGVIIVLLGTGFGINRYRKYKRQTLSDDSMKKGNWIPLSTDTAK